MRLPARWAAVNSRSFYGLSSGPETIFACAGFHCAKSLSTSALLSRLSQNKDGTYVAVGLSERAIGDRHFAIPPRDACDAALVVPPIEGEAQRVDVVGCRYVDVGRGDLRDRSGEVMQFVGFIVTTARLGPGHMRS
jgi:hypothetical protein